jgi:hypothetical protein
VSANDHLKILPATATRSRYLNPWAVVGDWAASADARFVGRETYRDYVRIVLTRTTPSGEQRLFLDPKTGYPVKIELQERHYLWGQRKIEYVNSNWTLVTGVMVPDSSLRIAEGQVEISQNGDVEIAAETRMCPAPSMVQPDQPAQAPDAPTLPATD